MAETEHTRAERRAFQHLPSKFQAPAPDDAMAPRVTAGTHVEFDQTVVPCDGDGVLVRTRAGELYFRLYRDAGSGCFEAVALNPSYREMCFSTQIDPDLKVVAVLTGVMVRWSRGERAEADGIAEALRSALHAWPDAAAEAVHAGRAYSSFDCYAHLGLGRRLQ